MRSAIPGPKMTSPAPTASMERMISRSAGALEQVAPRARPDRREHRLLVLHHRHHKDADVGRGLHDPLGGLDAVEPGHVQVHEHDVGLQVQGHRHRRRPVGRDADHLERAGGVEQGLEARDGSRRGRRRRGCGAVSMAYLGLSFVGPSGSRTRTWVPPPSGDVTVQLPPSSSARSRMEASPTPLRGSSGSPIPVSSTSTRSAPGIPAKRHGAVAGTAVPLGVVHRLDDDPVRRHLDGGGQPVELAVGPDRPGHGVRSAAGGGEVVLLGALSQRARPGRAGRGPADAARRPAVVPRRCPRWAWSASWPTRSAAPSGSVRMSSWARSRFIAMRGQRRAEPVVQVAADPPALLLAGRDEVLAGALELAVER